MSESEEPWEISEEDCYVALTNDHLNYQQVIDKVRSPAAGAIVVFAGTPSYTTLHHRLH